MRGDRYKVFDILARQRLENELLLWLGQANRRVQSITGSGHLVYVRWTPCAPTECTTGAAVLKFRSDHDDTILSVSRLNSSCDKEIHADGCNGFFFIVFYRNGAM